MENILDGQNKYKAIFELSPEAIIILDKKGKFIDANNRLYEWLDYEEKDVIGKNLIQMPFLPNHSRILAIKQFTKRMLGKDIEPYELDFETKDKHKKIGLILGTPIKDKKGKIIIDLVMISDVTKKKEAELQVINNLKQQKVLSKIAIILNTIDNFDDIMNDVVKALGKYTNVSRAYVFEDNFDNTTTSNVYEWCNKNVKAEKNNLQELVYDTMPSFRSILTKEGAIASDDIKKLPKDLYDKLAPQNIKALLVLPIFLGKKFFGFIGFDETKINRQWTDFDKEFLKTTAELIANAYQRKKMSLEMKENLDKLEKINKLMVGRELEMIKLKNKLKEKEAK